MPDYKNAFFIGIMMFFTIFYLSANCNDAIPAMIYCNIALFYTLHRVIIALQAADAFQIATPADWQPGDDVIVPTAGSCGVAKERMENKAEMHCYDWFFCTKKLEKEKVMSAIVKKQS